MSEPAEKVLFEMETVLERSYECGISFNFKLPKKGLALRGVVIEDGVSKLVFDAANTPDSPTISEEDVATIVRLVTEKKRPEFFYIAIPPGHPFHGRQYKQYCPQWLRGTSVGDVLQEADWEMKCLNIGAKTNKSKTVFHARRNTSKLEGLGTCMDFPQENPRGSIKMSCKSVKIKKTDKDLVFIGEPKMQIISDGSPTYSKYLTEVYDSIAYYDEPLFLKMKELIKLILAMEFLQEQGITFNKEWFMKQTSKNRSASQAIEVHDSEVPSFDFEEMLKHKPESEEEFEVSKVTKTGFKLINESVSENEQATVAVSINDYDLLYDEFDPREPLGHDDSIVPDVDTWSKLYRETVPRPHVWNFPFAILGIPTAIGGVTTNHIPVSRVTSGTSSSKQTPPVKSEVRREKQYETCPEEGKLYVSSSSMEQKSTKLPKNMVPERQTPRQPPRTNVRPNTRESHMNQAMVRQGIKDMYGYEDQGSMKMFHSNGKKFAQGESVKFATRHTDENGETQRSFLNLPLPPHLPGKMSTPTQPATASIMPSGSGHSLDSGLGTHSSEVTLQADTCTSETSDDACFSPKDGGTSTPRFAFLSPTGSDDEMGH